METLTFKQFARRYRKGDQQARDWIAAGTAPAKKIGNRYLIQVAWCDAYDRLLGTPHARPRTRCHQSVFAPHLVRRSSHDH